MNTNIEIKKKTGDMTVGNPFMTILKFAIPILIGNIFQQVYSMVDTIIVGRYLGPEKMAAVGLTGNITFFMFSLVIGLTGGIAVVVGQYYGAGDKKAVTRTYATSIFAVLGVTVVVTVLGVLFGTPLLRILRTPSDIIEYSGIYLRIIFIGTFATVLYNWMSSVLRALGDSVTPLIFLVISSVLNIGLDFAFIVGIKMDVAGAAWATVLSQFISAILCIAWAMKKMDILKLKKEDIKCDKYLLRTMLSVGLPAGIQASFIAVSVMLMQAAINAYGSIVVAGYIGAAKIEQLVMQVGFSIATATGNFTGQNMGAGKYKRIEQGHNASVIMVVICCIIISPLIYIFADKLMWLFTDDGENAARVIEIGAGYLRIMTFALVTVGILQVYQNLLRSAGDVSMTMIMGFSEVIFRVATAFIFSALFGYIGVWWATPITWALAMIVGVIRYFTGGWKSKGLIKA